MSKIGNLENTYTPIGKVRFLGHLEIYEVNDVSTVDIRFMENKELLKDLVDVFNKYDFNRIITPFTNVKTLFIDENSTNKRGI